MEPRIAITGKLGSGKDHLADWLIREHGFEKLSFAAPIKVLWKVVQEHAGFPEEKSFARPYLQAMGNAGRAFNENLWVDIALKNLHPAKKYVVTDLRFPNEEKQLRDAGFKIVLVRTPDAIRRARIEKRDGAYDPSRENDITETSIDDVTPDFTVNGEEEETERTRTEILDLLVG